MNSFANAVSSGKMEPANSINSLQVDTNIPQGSLSANAQRSLLGHHAHRNSISLPTSPHNGAANGVRFFSSRFSSTSSLDSSGSNPTSGSSPYSPSASLSAQGLRFIRETNRLARDVDESTGNKIINQYMILKELGRGVHGKVKLCKDMESGQFVAIKIVEKNSSRRGMGSRFSFHHRLSVSSQAAVASQSIGSNVDPGESSSSGVGGSAISLACMPPLNPHYEKIRKEIAILKKCNHPNVVLLKEVIDDPAAEKTYLVLEYLSGGDVRWQQALPDENDPLSANPVLSVVQARKIFRDLVAGVEYLHYQGILHRDIKPANLLYTEDQKSVKIGDFGVSCYIGKKRMMSSAYLYGKQRDAINSSHSLASSRQGSDVKLALSNSPISEFFPDMPTPLSAAPRSLSLDQYKHLSCGVPSQQSAGASPGSASPTKRSLLSIKKFRRSSQSEAANLQSRSKDPSAQQLLPSPFSSGTAPSLQLEEYHSESVAGADDEMVDNQLELAKTAGSPAFFAPEMCGVVDDDPSWLASAAQFEQPPSGESTSDSLGREPHQRHDHRGESKSLIARHPIFIGKAVDVWAMGVTLYCCIYGRVPFIGRSEFDLFNAICKSEHVFPQHVTVDESCRDLLNKLLDKNPFKRISISEIKHHPWVTADMTLEERRNWLQTTDPAFQGLPLQVTDEEIKSAIKVSIIKRIKESIRRISTSLSMGFSFSRNSSSSTVSQL